MGTLYLVATPIGNLEDITARALSILRQVQLIAAEDTRHTGRLLSHYDIHTPLTSYHEHNKLIKLERVLSTLQAGDVALVSDAGTPGLNDPGYELVRATLDAGYTVSPIPGPSAPISALVASGLPTDSFLYLGYLPRKSAERRNLLDQVASLPYTLVFLETPHRLVAALQDIREVLGDREMSVAREISKLHEEFFRGKVSQAQTHFQAQAPRGEITLVVAGQSSEAQVWPEARLRTALVQALELGEPPSQLARRMADASGWPRRKVYDLVIQLTKGST
jgi:16S rRNA (cytidine1402-2'-O)-methyltransferase